MLLVIECVIANKIPRCLQRSPRHPDFLPKPTKEPLWLSNLCKSMWVDSWLASLKTRQQSDPRTIQSYSFVSSCTSGDQLQSLRQGRELDSLLLMEQRGSVLSVNAYRSLLKACAQRKALAQAKQVQAHLARCGLESSRFLGEYIVATLAKCGGIEDALQLFHRLPHRTVFSWAALISGYAVSRQGHQALTMYRQMQEEGVQPNAYTFVSLLRVCGSLSDLGQGKRIHADVIKYDCGSDLFVGTCLVDMYGKCGSILDAQMVFDVLDQRDVVSWTAILTVHTQQGQPEKALQLYDQMLEEGVSPDVRTLVSVLQACGMVAENESSRHVYDPSTKLESFKKGRAVHAAAHRKGYDADVYLGNTLVSMYGKCGSTVDAQNVFDKLSHLDVVSWNAMIAAYGQQGRAEKAWQLYEQMREDGVSPDVRTFVSTLQACGMLADEEDDFLVSGRSIRFNSLYKCKIVHADAHRRGYESDVFLGNTLVSMYGKCRSSLDAHVAFNWLSQRNVVSWTAILLAYTLEGQAEKALEVYEQMQEEAASPNDRTFVSMLQVCGLLAEEEEGVAMCGQFIKVKSLEIGKAIHADVYRNEYISDDYVCSTLISMYGRCGSILDARVVFDGWAKQSVVAWTAMLTAYVEQGHGQEAVQLYRQMQQEGVSTDNITLVCILQACSNIGSLDMCTQVHHTLVSKRTNLVSPVLANTLIHAYGRCASMVDAQNVFDALVHPDVISWNALLAGYSRQGSYLATLQCYEEMQLAGIKPDGITFLSLLSACSHAGCVDQGVEYFKSMSEVHSITPEIEHYASMADLLGRAGYLKNVEDMLTTMPLQPSMSMWLCLLGACRKHGNVVLGKKAFDCAVRLEPKHAAAYVLMWNMYADAGLWDHANKINELRQKACPWQNLGQSWSEHERGVCSFGVGDSRHSQVYEMVGKVNMELSQEGNNNASIHSANRQNVKA